MKTDTTWRGNEVDKDLEERLTALEDNVTGAVMLQERGVDTLELRNELEEVEERLAEQIGQALDSMGRLMGMLESNSSAVERLSRRLDEIEETINAVCSEVS